MFLWVHSNPNVLKTSWPKAAVFGVCQRFRIRIRHIMTYYILQAGKTIIVDDMISLHSLQVRLNKHQKLILKTKNKKAHVTAKLRPSQSCGKKSKSSPPLITQKQPSGFLSCKNPVSFYLCFSSGQLSFKN